MIALQAPGPIVKLFDVASNVKNAIVDGPFGSSLKTSDYVVDGIPVLQGKNITGNKFQFTDIRFISIQKSLELIRSKVVVGDILIIKIGSIGYAAEIDDLAGYPYAIIPANLAKLTIDEKKINKRYLLHWLKTEYVKRYFENVASKTAQPALSLGKIKELPVPLPPLEEQQRIASLLDTADNVSRLREQAIAKLDELALSFFVEMFGDARTSDKWMRKSIQSVASVHTGKTPPTADTSNYADEVPFVTPTDLRGVITVSTRCVSKKGASLIKKVRAGSSLVGCIGDVGRVGFATMPVTFNQQINAVEWNEELIDDLYGYHALKYMEDVIKASAVSAVVPILNKTNFSNITIPVPPVTEQKKFADFIRQLWRVKKDMGSSIEKKLIGSLQHQSFAVN